MKQSALFSDFADVIYSPSLVIANFHFSCRLGGDGGERTSSEVEESCNDLIFSPLSSFLINHNPPRQSIGGEILMCNVLRFLPLLLQYTKTKFIIFILFN